MLLKDIEENLPFITVLTYGGNEYVGIVINQDVSVTSMYVYTKLKTEEEKRKLLDLGEIWWWESNRLIPINVFLRKELEDFSYAIQTMNSKDVKITIGPSTSVNNLSSKRIKRRSIQLIRKPS